MGHKSRLGENLRRFMSGRNGLDLYGRFLSVFSVAAILLALVTSALGMSSLSAFFTAICLASLIWTYWRLFSRNIAKRQEENRRYLAIRERVTSWFRLQKDRIRQRKDYAFFRCPGCRSIARVPRGKGRIRVTCRRCGYTFERKT